MCIGYDTIVDPAATPWREGNALAISVQRKKLMISVSYQDKIHQEKAQKPDALYEETHMAV
jgi:hypothetical protein